MVPQSPSVPSSLSLLHCTKKLSFGGEKSLELADASVDKYGEAMMDRWTVVCTLPRAILQKGVRILKEQPITLDMLLENEDSGERF